jgi:hypothetical protein
MSVDGMFHGLSCEFVSGQVVFFAVVRSSDSVSVRGKVVVFSGFLVRIIWHGCLSDQ